VGGAVSERLVQVGEFIPEQTPVVTIVQMNPLNFGPQSRSATRSSYGPIAGAVPG